MTRPCGERGVTMLEMLVSVTVLTLAMTSVWGLLLQSSRINRSQQLTVTAQSDARTCMAMIEARLRTTGWDPMSAGIQLVRLDSVPGDGIDEIETYADLDADGDTDGIDEQVLIRHIEDRIEWRRSATGPFEILATGITNDADGDGTADAMFIADSTTQPTRIVVRITAESAAADPVSGEPRRYTVASEIALRKRL
jgi:type II secretory pathway component PulJ